MSLRTTTFFEKMWSVEFFRTRNFALGGLNKANEMNLAPTVNRLVAGSVLCCSGRNKTVRLLQNYQDKRNKISSAKRSSSA